VAESEANNDVGTADDITVAAGGVASLCGVIESGADVDFFAFTLPAGATSLGFHRYGDTTSPNSPDLQAVLLVDGTEYQINGAFPVQAGKKYVVKVSTKDRAPIKYRVAICARGGACD